MSILPDFMIRNIRIADGAFLGRHVLAPWSERTVQSGMSYGLSCAGFDIRSKQAATLEPGGCALLSSVEHFWMPDDLLARVADKSTWARRFICVQNTVIEPGWRGWLTLEVTNHGQHAAEIRAGDPIAQILFERMAAAAERPYRSKYQDQADMPVPALQEVRS